MPEATRRAAPIHFSASAPAEVAGLATQIQDPDREKPLVVVTVDYDAPGPYVSPADLAEAVGTRATVWFITSAELSYALTSALPGKEFSAYNGAVRIYPPGTDWLADPFRAPLLLAQTPERRDSLFEDVVAEVNRLDAVVGTPTPDPPPSPTRPNDTTLTWVDDPALAAELARELVSEDRTRPIVVITIAAQESQPFVDPGAVARELHGIAPVFVLPTGAVTWAFSDLLPSGTDVYGGASRVYPVRDGWLSDPYRSPLRFATNRAEGAAVADLLIGDALGMAAEGGYRSGVAMSLPEVSGEVLGITAGRALVRLDNGDNASVWPELVAPGIPAKQVFRRGQRVIGRVDPEFGRLDLTDSVRSPAYALAEVQVDDVVLTRVAYVDPDVCVLELFPDFLVDVPREDIVQGPNAVDLRRFLTEGEVLRVQVTERGETDEDWRLTALVDDEGLLPAPAPALLPDGPPWLIPVKEVEEIDEPHPPAPRPRTPAPVETVREPASASDPALRQQLVDARTENARLLAELREKQRELNEHRQREQRAKKQLREANNTIARLRKESSDGRDALASWEAYRGRFDNPTDQLRLDIELAWARRFPEGDRPLAEWTVGSHFFRSWGEIEGISRSKVVDVLVEVLTGLDAEQQARELHQLRTGDGGNDPVVTRPDGATAWRVSLQVKTPSARRLHYWRLPDGSIEFSSVRLHDDFRP
ncbi:hypothetical protein AADG42_09350 [Ammonicoccus fulvus]|uniref:S1 motif domain-containing protein n=1 Tax=Ammonicoccus fulvus TaxID=3138240 RepID=A0ABZ3FQQ5_9ACTN